MGTTSLWVMSSVHPEMSHKIRLAVALGPVAKAAKMKSPIKYFVPFAPQIEVKIFSTYINGCMTLKIFQILLKLTNQHEFWSKSSLQNKLGRLLCQANRKLRDSTDSKQNVDFCDIPENIIFILAGFDKEQMDKVSL